jgi:hypothetical protein
VAAFEWWHLNEIIQLVVVNWKYLNDRKWIAQFGIKSMIEFIYFILYGSIKQIHLQVLHDFFSLGNYQFVDQGTLCFYFLYILIIVAYLHIDYCLVFVTYFLPEDGRRYSFWNIVILSKYWRWTKPRKPLFTNFVKFVLSKFKVSLLAMNHLFMTVVFSLW